MGQNDIWRFFLLLLIALPYRVFEFSHNEYLAFLEREGIPRKKKDFSEITVEANFNYFFLTQGPLFSVSWKIVSKYVESEIQFHVSFTK